MVLAADRPSSSEEQNVTSWDRARLSVVVPIGVIVAVAIVCIVVAVLSSAQRADEVAIQHEKQLFVRALNNYGERVLREVKSVAASEQAIQNIRVKFDPAWIEQRVGLWLETYFDHDFIFIFDGNDKPIYTQIGRRAAEPLWLDQAQPDLEGVVDFGVEADGAVEHRLAVFVLADLQIGRVLRRLDEIAGRIDHVQAQRPAFDLAAE